MKNISLITILFAGLSASAQTAAIPSTTPTISVTNITLPTYIAVGMSYNQFTGAAAFVSGLIPETSKAGGLYGSVTADINAAKVIDPATGKSGYGVSPSFRFGQHKVVYNGTTTTTTAGGTVIAQSGNMLLIGGDFGASWNQVQTTTTSPLGVVTTSGAPGLSIGLAGSFTLTYVRQFTPHLAMAVPIRMLWMSGVGPGATGVWNPVGEIALVWKP
jgi:hypothetical protein